MTVPRNRTDWAVIAISTLGTLTSVVVATSQQRPASAIALMIAIGCSVIGGAILTWKLRDSAGSLRVQRRWRVTAAAASILIVVAMIVVPLTPSIGRPLRHDLLGFSDPGYDVQIQGITVAQKESAFRTSLTVLNGSSTSYTLNRIGLRLGFTPSGINGCHDNGGGSYRIESVINVAGTKTPGRHNLEGTVKDSDQYAYKAKGSLNLGCADGTLELGFPANLALPAKQTTMVDIEFPKRFRVASASVDPWGWGGATSDSNPSYISVALPVDKGRTYQSERQEGKYTVSLGVGGSSVSRDHLIPAEIHGF